MSEAQLQSVWATRIPTSKTDTAAYSGSDRPRMGCSVVGEGTDLQTSWFTSDVGLRVYHTSLFFESSWIAGKVTRIPSYLISEAGNLGRLARATSRCKWRGSKPLKP